MICPVCKQPTKRLIYRRTEKLCPNCADPMFIRPITSLFPAMEFSRMYEWFGERPAPALGELYRCVINPQEQSLYRPAAKPIPTP